MANDRFTGLTVREILQHKKASITRAPLPAGSPGWDSILDMTWEEIVAAAQSGQIGFRTIRKLLADTRFDK